MPGNQSTKHIPLLYNAIIRTGLAGIPDIPPLEDVAENTLLLPFVEDMPAMQEKELREILVANITIFLHNAIVAHDFPTNVNFEKLLVTSEANLQRIKRNPWLQLMHDYGRAGKCPEPEIIDINHDPASKMALAMSRDEWLKVVPKFVISFVDWFVENREAVQEWQIDRLKAFS